MNKYVGNVSDKISKHISIGNCALLGAASWTFVNFFYWFSIRGEGEEGNLKFSINLFCAGLLRKFVFN